MSNKKIGLLSVYNHNYGSILQAYALQRVLEDSDYMTEIIVFKKTNLLKQATRLLYFPLLKSSIKMKWKNVYCRLVQPQLYRNEILSRECTFNEFKKNNLKFSRVYKGRQELCKSYNDYDYFVLGSDQVWNPMNIGGDFFTLTFVPEKKIKMTYAPSFGVADIPKCQIKKTQKYLERIDYISVRELEGKEIVKNLINRDVPVVLDPTLLIDKKIWDEKKGMRIINEDYIFCYFISNNVSHREFAKRIAEKKNLKIVALPHIDEYVKADIGL